MSFASLLQDSEIKGRLPSLGPVAGVGAALTENMEAMADNVWKTRTITGELQYRGGAFRDRNEVFKQRFGKDQFAISGALDKYPSRDPEAIPTMLAYHQKQLDDFIEKGRVSDPDKFNDIKTSGEIQADMTAMARRSDTDLEEVQLRNRDRWLASGVGGLAGGLAAGIADVPNLLTMAVGAGEMQAGLKGFSYFRAVMKTAATEGTLNAAVEAAQIPATAEWQKYTGHRYGAGEAAQDVAFAFGGGAAFSAMMHGIAPAIRSGAEAIGSASQHVFEKIAFSRWMPEGMRETAAARRIARHLDTATMDATQFMARQAHIDETHPPGSVTDEPSLEAHREKAAAVAEDFENYRDSAPSLGERNEPPPVSTQGAAQTASETHLDTGVPALKNQAEFLKLIEPQKIADGVYFDPNKSARDNLRDIPEDKFEDHQYDMHDAMDEYTAGVEDFVNKLLKQKGIEISHSDHSKQSHSKYWSIRKIDADVMDDDLAKVRFSDHGDHHGGNDLNVFWGEHPDAIAEQILKKAGIEPEKPVSALEGTSGAGQASPHAAMLEHYAPPSPAATRALPDLSEAPPVPEIERMTRARADFDAVVKGSPDLPVMMEDGRIMTLQQISDMVQEDIDVMEAITSCRLA